MRILLVSFYFPPYNTAASVRLGKTAKYLSRFGHDIRVLTARNQRRPKTLPVELDAERIIYSSWIDVNRIGDVAPSGRASAGAAIFHRRGLKAKAGILYKTLFNFPDPQIGWFPYAASSGMALMRTWCPHIISASAMPATSLLVAHSLARRSGLPWVAEFQDPWSDNHNYFYPAWRRRIDDRWERRVVRSSAGLVTVSEPWAERMRRKHGLPTCVITSGFDAGDYPDTAPACDEHVRIAYTGTIYPGRQDPSPLFKALKALGDERRSVSLHFCGRGLESLYDQASSFGVQDCIRVHGEVSYGESLAMQRSADLLLLLSWNDEKEQGVLPAKLFEYLGAGRPILTVGMVENSSTKIILQRDAGVFFSQPDKIASYLQRCLTQKRTQGSVPDLSGSAASGFSWEEQTRRLEAFLLERVG